MLTNTTNQQQIAVTPITYKNYTLLAKWGTPLCNYAHECLKSSKVFFILCFLKKAHSTGSLLCDKTQNGCVRATSPKSTKSRQCCRLITASRQHCLLWHWCRERATPQPLDLVRKYCFLPKCSFSQSLELIFSIELKCRDNLGACEHSCFTKQQNQQ